MGRSLFFLLLFAFWAIVVHGGSSGKSGSSGGRQREQTFRGAGFYGQAENSRNVKPEQNEEPVVRRKGPVLSAWGIVTLVVSIILLSIIAYYCTIFYPMLCKKERKYDIIELEKV